MLKIYFLVVLLTLSGCGLTPPKPPTCTGEFYPVNVPTEWNNKDSSYGK